MAMFASMLTFCARHPSESGTGDPQLDAELQSMQQLERRMEALVPLIDSLSCVPSKTEAQEDELQRVVEQMNSFQIQWEESRRRAAERAQGNWNRVCPFKNSGMDCVDSR
jgi:hypothetical protein